MLRYWFKALLILVLLGAFHPAAMACNQHDNVNRVVLAAEGDSYLTSNDCPMEICGDLFTKHHISAFKIPVVSVGLLASAQFTDYSKFAIDLHAVRSGNSPGHLYRRQILFPFHGFW